MQLAFDFAEMNGLSHRFNTEKRLAGKDWAVSFCMWLSLKLCTPEQCSIGSVTGFSRVQVTLLVVNLKTCHKRNKFPPDRCFFMGETGRSTVLASMPKVVTTEGRKSCL
jgi:hypothetical protein